VSDKIKQLVYIRRFLNKEHDYGLASVLADLSYTVWDTQSPTPYLGSESRLEISDCDKIIKLALPTSSNRDIKLSIRKINILLDVLGKYKVGLEKLDAKKKQFDKGYKEKVKKAKKKEDKLARTIKT
jgi:hypothetical protein